MKKLILLIILAVFFNLSCKQNPFLPNSSPPGSPVLSKTYCSLRAHDYSIDFFTAQVFSLVRPDDTDFFTYQAGLRTDGVFSEVPNNTGFEIANVDGDELFIPENILDADYPDKSYVDYDPPSLTAIEFNGPLTRSLVKIRLQGTDAIALERDAQVSLFAVDIYGNFSQPVYREVGLVRVDLVFACTNFGSYQEIFCGYVAYAEANWYEVQIVPDQFVFQDQMDTFGYEWYVKRLDIHDRAGNYMLYEAWNGTYWYNGLGNGLGTDSGIPVIRGIMQ